jgi:hypothetical protein
MGGRFGGALNVAASLAINQVKNEDVGQTRKLVFTLWNRLLARENEYRKRHRQINGRAAVQKADNSQRDTDRSIRVRHASLATAGSVPLGLLLIVKISRILSAFMKLREQWERILIWGKTYPDLSSKYLETVCTAGVTELG